MLIDITRTIGQDTIVYPGDSPPLLDRTDSIAREDSFNATHLSISAHCGTHLDAPAHFIPDGQTIDDMPLERFKASAHVFDTGDASLITAAFIQEVAISAGDAVLFKTANGKLPRDKYVKRFTCLALDAAQVLIESRIGLVGIDYLSIESDENPNAPVHKALLGAGILILEDIDLRQVSPGCYTLFCFPLRLYQTEASPCRAVLEKR